MALRISIVIFIFFLPFFLKAQNCNSSDANKFLSSLFHGGKYISKDSISFKKYNDDLVPLETPFLNKILPGYCFYTTIFLSPFYEYINVETALAFSKKSNKKSFIVFSPSFVSTPKEFIQLFYGLETNDTLQSIKLANEIVNIFSAITYKGRISRLLNLKDSSVISFELWTDDLSWRIYDFTFTKTNILDNINITGGFKRGKIEGYKRL